VAKGEVPDPDEGGGVVPWHEIDGFEVLAPAERAVVDFGGGVVEDGVDDVVGYLDAGVDVGWL